MISSMNIDAIIKIINGSYGPEEWVTDVFKHFLDFSNSHALFTNPFVYYGCIASFLLQLGSESFKGPPQLCLGRRKSDVNGITCAAPVESKRFPQSSESE